MKAIIEANMLTIKEYLACVTPPLGSISNDDLMYKLKEIEKKLTPNNTKED